MGANTITRKHHMLVEVWQPNDRWHALSNDEKRSFLTKVAGAANAAREAGIEIMGWGALERSVSNPADQSFCGVFFVDSREALHAVDGAIRDTGWYDYFDHMNVATALGGRDGVDAAQTLCELLGVA
jgi:hypothetical protein